jgi:hypothetical protein
MRSKRIFILRAQQPFGPLRVGNASSALPRTRVRLPIPFAQNKNRAPFGTRLNYGGGRGIRTLDTVSRIHAFQACAFSHSATPPYVSLKRRSAVAGLGVNVLTDR